MPISTPRKVIHSFATLVNLSLLIRSTLLAALCFTSSINAFTSHLKCKDDMRHTLNLLTLSANQYSTTTTTMMMIMMKTTTTINSLT